MTEQIQVIPQLREDLKRSQTHLQQVTKQRADLNAQLELVQQTVSLTVERVQLLVVVYLALVCLVTLYQILVVSCTCTIQVHTI